MVNFTILQVVLLTLLAFIKHVDYYGIPMIFVNYAVFWGLITGVVMGDWQTGLVIGGTIQLMQLGVAGFGGSSIPDYGTMAIIATAYGVTLGTDTGLAIGLPVGMLGIQLDVIVKILNGFVVEKSQKFCDEGKFKQMNAILWVCPVLFGLCAALPVFVSVTLGQPAVELAPRGYAPVVPLRPHPRRQDAPGRRHRDAAALHAHRQVLPVPARRLLPLGLPERAHHRCRHRRRCPRDRVLPARREGHRARRPRFRRRLHRRG